MSDDKISFSVGEINLITSLLTHAYQSWTEMLEEDDFPEGHTREDCEAILEIIVETLEKFLIILEEVSDDDDDDESEENEENVPNNIIKFPFKK